MAGRLADLRSRAQRSAADGEKEGEIGRLLRDRGAWAFVLAGIVLRICAVLAWFHRYRGTIWGRSPRRGPKWRPGGGDFGSLAGGLGRMDRGRVFSGWSFGSGEAAHEMARVEGLAGAGFGRWLRGGVLAGILVGAPFLFALELQGLGVSWAFAVAVQLAFALVSALVVGMPATRRVMGVLVAILGLGWAFCISPEQGGVRGAVCVLSILTLMRTLDLAVDGANWDWKHRVWQVLGVVDIRELQRRRQSYFDIVDVGLGLGFLSVAVVGVIAALFCRQEGFELWWLWPVRWLCGAAAMYCIPECSQAFVRFLYKLVGYDTPPLHRNPVLACSVREFWGERWNLVVHRWLRRHFFWPFARRRMATLGVVVAFFASAAIHYWFIFAAVDAWTALWMALFFLTQGVLVLVEAQLGWSHRESGIGARVWTVCCVVLPSPLFVEPALRVFEVALVGGIGALGG